MGSIDCNEPWYERTFSEVEEVLAMHKELFYGKVNETWSGHGIQFSFLFLLQ